MTLAEPSAPPWMPPDGTAAAVPAGVHWDAVAVPQHVGLAATEILDRETGRRPGPIAWDTSLRAPRIYFLTSTGIGGLAWRHERILSRSSYVTLPGQTAITPPGPCWLVPPNPDDPGRLVDADLLRRALDRVRSDAAVEYRPIGGRSQRMLVTSAQLNGMACIVCGEEPLEVIPAGYAFTPPDGPSRLPWPVMACGSHGLEAEG